MEVPNVWRQVEGIAERLDHWQEVRFDPPGCMVTYLWFSTPGTARESGYLVYAPNIITPETDETTHYFWAIVRNFNLDDEGLSASFRSGAQSAFEAEDKPMLEAQQRHLGQRDLMEMHPVLLPNDSGSARARRIVSKRIEREARERTIDNSASGTDVPAAPQNVEKLGRAAVPLKRNT
jgi:vanillate O-demethylase monooxygenase subunit